MLKAIAAILKHDFRLPREMLADSKDSENVTLKHQVARSTLFLRLKDWGGKYVLPTGISNRSEAQMKLSPNAEEEICDWALLHWRNNDTQSSFQVCQFAPLVVQNQGLSFETEDGLPSNRWWDRFLWHHPILFARDTQATESSRPKA